MTQPNVDYVDSQMQVAWEHHHAGRLGDAQRICCQILGQSPENVEALDCLARIAAQVGRHNTAIDSLLRVLKTRPDSPEILGRLGCSQMKSGRLRDAVLTLQRAIELKPSHSEAHYDLGNTLALMGEFDAGNAACRRAIDLNPADPRAFSNLGVCLRAAGDNEAAIVAYQRAIELGPAYAEAWNNLGNALRNIDRLDEAIDAYREAIRLKPAFAQADSNLSAALLATGKPDEAVAAARRAVRVAPEFAAAHWNLSWALLLSGDFAAGWDEFEWRWKWNEFPTPARDFGVPRWEGQNLNGKTLLLHTEQGLGDVIQFSRYATLCADRGARVLLEVAAPLERLCRSIPGVSEVLVYGQSLPSPDLHCPILSLPHVFRTRLDSIPAPASYLRPAAADVDRWRRIIETTDANPFKGHISATSKRFGLAWAGNPAHQNDRNRSIAPALLKPLCDLRIRIYSLQVGSAASQAPEMNLLDHSAGLTDFAETAALLANLDLIISVDSAVAHLAGAMGKPVYLLLPFAPDWRWLLGRTDSPWYPTVRLFRQTKKGDWAGVIERVVAALQGTGA